MPVCCKCNSSGLCKKCSCKKAGRFCTGCLPSRTGRCQNSSGPVGDANTSVHDADTFVMEATGVLQLCAGQEAGCEVAVHALREVFNSSDCEAVLLVDASNAFNSLNRQVALRNVRHLCPPLATILINTYRSDVNLFIEK